MAEEYLYKTINSQKEAILKFSPEALTIPEYILSNIKFPMFDWQLGALQNFLYYENPKSELKSEPTHLLFNMATGTGKTLLMAALILYYYEKGYRHFLFFVNQNNIVGKTEDNLTDPAHTKYLFTNPIVINNKTVNVKKVDTFSDSTEDIEILFTSIHKLHNAVYQVKENSIFLEDLQNRNIVMLADEAHHLNSDTKKNKGQLDLEVITELPENASAEMIEKSWEHTVTKLILQKEGASNSDENKNVLLEFTATVPKEESVVKKYIDKTIYSFELKDFLKAGFTKEINLVSSSFNKKQRVIQALLFNWFRYEIAIKNNLPNFKPVILFRSKFVDEKNPENVKEDYDFFREIIDNLSVEDFSFLSSIEKGQVEKVYEMGQSRIVDISKYISENNINYTNIITYLKDAFKDSNCIITHSKDKKATGRRGEDKTTPEQDKLLNSLEDKHNPITAIFTCQRLTEGWDVLNLYDIVRMYEGQNTGGSNKGAAGKSTVSEVQLIVRGVRYYPFDYEDKIRNKRKFDKALTNELRVLEEFFFHSDKDERYIAELKKELKRQELIPEKDKQLKIFDIKPEIKEDKNSFYHKVKIYKNDRKPNPNKRKRSLEELKKVWVFEYKIVEQSVSETTVNFEEKQDDKTRLETATNEGRTLSPKVNEIERHILYKALNVHSKKDQSILRFNKLKDELAIEQTEDLFKDEFIGDLKLKVVVPSQYTAFSEIPNKEQVEVFTTFFNQFSEQLSKISHPFIGSDFEPEKFKTYYEIPKTISVVEDSESNDLERELKDKPWYALTSFYGTTEEKGLVKFLKETMDNFKDKYEDIYLLRNEEVYKIYDFAEGRGFMPDFLLFLKSKGKNMYYQVFIEPKGTQFKDATGGFDNSKEGWKEKFLYDISNKYAGNSILKSENKEYKLVGLPLYNVSSSSNFKNAAKEFLVIDV
jgi:type III restriction enzyme